MPKNDVSISISPTEPHYGDDLTVTIEGSEGLGVFAIQCFDADDKNIYNDGGNNNDPVVTLRGGAWLEGGASCTILAREQRNGGRPYTAATFDFDVLP